MMNKYKKRDVTHGVRTRARTLALRSFDSNYLHLRSRLLLRKIHTPVVQESNHESIQPCSAQLNKEERRSTRERTSCNLKMAADDITTTPASSTKQRSPPRDAQNDLMEREIEDFFTQAEHSQQQLFIQKYNFDVVHDKPLSGRYEWVKVTP